MRSGYGYNGYKQSVSNARKQGAVKHALASSWAPQLQKDYLAYIGHLQEQGIDKTKAKSIDDFTLERMEPYFQAEKIEIGHAPPRVDGAGSGKVDGQVGSFWETAVMSAIQKPGSVIDFNARAMDATLSNRGQYNLNGIKTPLGDAMDLGLVNGVSTGEAVVHTPKNAKPYMEHKVMVRYPIDQFMKLGEKYDKVIDEAWTNQIHPGQVEGSNWEIHNEYQNDFKKVNDEKGNAYVEFPVYQNLDPVNVTTAANYNHANYAKPVEQDPYQLGQSNAVAVNTQADYDALPSGAQYSANGQTYIKK